MRITVLLAFFSLGLLILSGLFIPVMGDSNNITGLFNPALQHIPELSNENPSNASTDVELTPQLSITCNDSDGESMAVNWSSNSSGSWIVFGYNQSTNATFYQDNSNFSSYLQRYYWRVNVTDGTDYHVEEYYFTTELGSILSPSNLVASDPTVDSIVLEWSKGGINGTHVHDLLYVDNFSKYGGNPVFDKSDTGSWASTGIRENVLLTNSTGYAVKVDGKYVMYFNGRTSPPSKFTRIGRANSSDGVNWDVANDPVFNDTNANYYTFVGSVIQRGENDYIMYYGAKNDTSQHTFKYATSTNSISWTAQDEILNETDFTDVISVNIPNVIYFDGEWHMVLECDTSAGFKIFYANSSDGENWTAKADAIYSGSVGEWDSEDAANPSLYKLDTGKYVIFYNGNSQESGYIFDLGILYSTSITSGWTSWKNNPILEHGSDTEWDDTRIEGPRVLMDDIGNATLRLWYFGLPTGNSFADGAIGYAVCNETFINTMVRYSTSDNLSTYTDGSLGYNGTDSYTTVTGLESNTLYYFRAWSWNETSGWNTTGSNTVNLTTSAGAGNASMTTPYPVNESWTNYNDSTMNITVSNPLGEEMDVHFYWFNNGTLIGSNLSVENNTVANLTVPFNYEFYQQYYWNVTVVSSSYNNQSGNWTIQAESEHPDVSRNSAVGPEDLSGVAAHYMEEGAYGRWIRADVSWNGAIGPEDLSGIAAHYMEEY